MKHCGSWRSLLKPLLTHSLTISLSVFQGEASPKNRLRNVALSLSLCVFASARERGNHECRATRSRGRRRRRCRYVRLLHLLIELYETSELGQPAWKKCFSSSSLCMSVAAAARKEYAPRARPTKGKEAQSSSCSTVSLYIHNTRRVRERVNVVNVVSSARARLCCMWIYVCVCAHSAGRVSHDNLPSRPLSPSSSSSLSFLLSPTHVIYYTVLCAAAAAALRAHTQRRALISLSLSLSASAAAAAGAAAAAAAALSPGRRRGRPTSSTVITRQHLFLFLSVSTPRNDDDDFRRGYIPYIREFSAGRAPFSLSVRGAARATTSSLSSRLFFFPLAISMPRAAAPYCAAGTADGEGGGVKRVLRALVSFFSPRGAARYYDERYLRAYTGTYIYIYARICIHM